MLISLLNKLESKLRKRKNTTTSTTTPPSPTTSSSSSSTRSRRRSRSRNTSPRSNRTTTPTTQTTPSPPPITRSAVAPTAAAAAAAATTTTTTMSRSSFLPLSGTSVMIVDASSSSSRTRTKYQELVNFVTALGGTVLPLDHCIIHPPSSSLPSSSPLNEFDVVLWNLPSSSTTTIDVDDGDDISILSTLSPLQHQLLQDCLRRKIPIVEPSSWLQRVSGLREHEHWSEIPLDPHVPAVLTFFQESSNHNNYNNHQNHHSTLSTTNKRSRGNNLLQTTTSWAQQVWPWNHHHSNNNHHHRGTFADDTSIAMSASIGGGGSVSTSSTWRRDDASNLGKSISATFHYLTHANPDQMNDEAIRRAMELSMLDLALVFYHPQPEHEYHHQQPAGQSSSSASSVASTSTSSRALKQPHEILQVPPTATPTELKAAYRKLARIHHPDKGGDSDTFDTIAKAYRTMLRRDQKHHQQHGSQDEFLLESHSSWTSMTTATTSRQQQQYLLKSTAHWDSELQDHRRLVNDLFQAHGGNLDASVAQQQHVMSKLGLLIHDAGAINRNEQDELIHNSCFYLSLASSYLHGITALIDDETTDKALIGQTALQLKRVIEAAVVKAHPEWAAQGMVGEQVQAFSDFLTYSLDGTALVSDWAVVVFDAVSGFCDVYKGCHYTSLATKPTKVITVIDDDDDDDEYEVISSSSSDESAAWARSNTITLLYTPGHYQPLISETIRPTLEEILKELDAAEVFYVITDGAS